MEFMLTVVLLVTVAVVLTVFAVAARRLLDLRFGLVRTLLAGALVLAIGGPLMRAFSGAVDPGDSGITPLWFLILAVVCALLAGMVFLVVAEALAPPGSIPGPLELVRERAGGWSGRAATWRSPGSWSGTASAPTSAAGTPPSAAPPAGRGWPGRCARPWTTAASPSSSSARSCPPGAICCRRSSSRSCGCCRTGWPPPRGRRSSRCSPPSSAGRWPRCSPRSIGSPSRRPRSRRSTGRG
nr:hypothetical protein GCM10020093_036110 [Planobispora longispora]